MDTGTFKYTELATVSVKQSYYANGMCQKYQIEPALDFELLPTDECLALMKRLNIVFRRTDYTGGFVVLGRVLGTNAGGEELLRFPPQAGDKLSFWVKLNNPAAINFDDLPISHDSGGLYYFSNQQTDTTAPRNNLHLTNTASGVSGSNDYIRKSAANYRFHHTAQVAAGIAKVLHVLSGMEVLPDSIVNQAGQADLVFNLNSLPLGKCRLMIAGSVMDEFYFTGSPAFPVFGVIELLLSATLESNYRIVEADRALIIPRPAYTILFQNRKTFWRYTIHLQPSSPLFLEMAALNTSDKTDFLNRLNIVTNDAAISFTRISATDNDIVFVSDSDVPLQEKYVSSSSPTHAPLSLTLKKYIGVLAKEANVRSDLSYPQTGLIDATTPSVIYSDVFLTF